MDRLADTVTDIVALARDLPDGQRSSVRQLLDGVSQRWHALLAEQTRPLRVTMSDGVSEEVAISPAAATQILDVLIDNARVHGHGAVTVHARALGTGVAFDVSDEGAGPGGEAYQIFANRDRARIGGIGLPFARRLAEAESARVTLTQQSPPTFTLVASSARSSVRGDQDTEAGE